MGINRGARVRNSRQRLISGQVPVGDFVKAAGLISESDRSKMARPTQINWLKPESCETECVLEQMRSPRWPVLHDATDGYALSIKADTDML